jgi:hypothetical protein
MNSQQKYYLAHREELLKKMRERNAKYRAERKAMIEADPVERMKEQTRWRTYYHARCERNNKAAVEALLKEAREDAKEMLQTILREDKYKNFTANDLKSLRSIVLP